MEFTEFRQIVKDRCRKASACQTQFKRLLEAETFEPFFEVLKDSSNWVFGNNILDAELLLQVKEEANKADIWVNENCSSGILYAFNATVQAWGNATVQASGNATVRASENAFISSYSFVEGAYIVTPRAPEQEISTNNQ